VALLAAVGVSLTILEFSVVLGFERGRQRQDFEFKAAGLVAALQSEMDSHVAAVHSLQSLYSATESVSRQEFAVFARNERSAHSSHKAIQALEWIPLVTANERAGYEAAIQAEGFSGFSIHERDTEGVLIPARERSEGFPVTYVQPYSGNEAALGFDLASNPSRYAALREARDSGNPVATQRIVLVQEVSDQFGFLVFIPVYRTGSVTTTVQQRTEALAGFALGVFRIGDLVNSAWNKAGIQPQTGENSLFLFDRSAPEGFQALSALGDSETGAVDPGQLTFTDILSIGGRVWEATVTSPRQSVLAIWQPWSALMAGLSLTVIVVAYLLLAMQRESRTQLLVEQRTWELSKTNQQLEDEVIDRSKAQQELAGLYEISSIFSAVGDFETKATQALDKLAVLAAADWVTLRLPKKDEPGLHLVAASGPAVAQHAPVAVFTESMAMSAQAFAEGKMMVIGDYATRPTASQALVDLGMRSMVILPVKSGDRTMGLVTVISKDENHFGPDLVHLLAAVGEGLGVLLDNSLLHEQTERAYGELQTLDKMKDEFISTVSHELRTPLTSIKGAAEILMTYRDEDPAIQQEFLGIIDSESDRLTRLIDDVLDLARIESGETGWETSQVNLPSAIETAVDITHALTLQKNVTVKALPSNDVPTVESDTDKLVQVITNLLSNAIKFTPSGGMIHVQSRLLPRTGQANGVRMAEVSVSDNGLGIATTEHDRIFDRFQQAESSLSDRPAGTGLGLAISKEIVVRLGGEIWVESEPGKGSTFFFTVPVVEATD
jgi:signal transduction histidine kinase/CHASE1-domain containing sensor protein